MAIVALVMRNLVKLWCSSTIPYDQVTNLYHRLPSSKWCPVHEGGLNWKGCLKGSHHIITLVIKYEGWDRFLYKQIRIYLHFPCWDLTRVTYWNSAPASIGVCGGGRGWKGWASGWQQRVRQAIDVSDYRHGTLDRIYKEIELFILII